MTKKEFLERVQFIKRTSSLNLDLISRTQEALASQRTYEDLGQHDPELARLCREADASAIEPLKRIVAHLSKRFDH